MIFNIPPLCKKPVTVFTGIATLDDVYAVEIKQQVSPGENNSPVYVDQMDGFIQMNGPDSFFGSFGHGHGTSHSPYGLYIAKPVNLSGKKKVIVKAASCYTASNLALESVAPIAIIIFKDLNTKMWNDVHGGEMVPMCCAWDVPEDQFSKDPKFPAMEDITIDVSELSGDFYVGFSIADHSIHTVTSYYLRIGEIVAF